MPPDFLLRCTACGHEAVWDTEACPPVGVPEIGHPVLWQCDPCGSERRHVIACQVVITEKLHHEICVATEIDRPTVDRVMGEVHRYRQRTRDALADIGSGSTETEIEDVADATGVAREVVGHIASAEAAWMLRRGYAADAHEA
jgi:hypothetical protein